MKTLFIIQLFLLAAFMVSAQELISSAGETKVISGIEISWSLGEPVIETVSGGATVLTQGFHQSKLTVTALEEIENLNLKVYPNPTSEFVVIQFSTPDKISSYSLFDLSGKLLDNSKINATTTYVNLNKLASGSYLLKIDDKNAQRLQTFKIIKK